MTNSLFLAKAVEKLIPLRLRSHLEENDLYPDLQPAYRYHHSVETALLNVTNDILCALDNRQAVLLVLFDVSSAFDTVDHEILLQRLHDDVDIRGLCLQ